MDKREELIAQFFASRWMLQSRSVMTYGCDELRQVWCQFVRNTGRGLVHVKKFIEDYFEPENGGAEIIALQGILRWVHLRLSWKQEFRSWPTSTKLATEWLHASMLRTVFCRGGSPNRLAEWFLGNIHEMDADYASVLPYDRDVSNPKYLDYGGLFLRGLAYVFEGADSATISNCGLHGQIAKAFEDPNRSLVGSPSFWRLVDRQPNHLSS